MSIPQILIPPIYAAIILLVTWVVARLTMLVLRGILGQSTKLLDAQIQRLVWMLVWLIGLILAIEQLGINSNVLLLIVGLFGFAAIVAIRGPLENLGARYFIQGYIPFKVGDSITVHNHSGKVIEANAMSIILLTRNYYIVSIPNSVFIKATVANTTNQAWKNVKIPIVIKNKINLPSFENVLLKSLNKLRQHFDDRFPPILTVISRNRQFTELALNVMIRSPEERDAIVGEVNKRIEETIEAMQNVKK